MALLAWAVVVSSGEAWGQLQTLDLRGRVVDLGDAPVAGARVVLVDLAGIEVASVRTDPEGRFAVRRLPRGRYRLRAESGHLRSALQPLDGNDGFAQVVTLRVVPGAQETLEVSGTGLDEGSTLSGELVQQLAGGLPTRGLQAAIATLPGWTSEDNGLLHARGVDDGFLYVVDGVPVYERLDPLFGLAPHATTIGSLQVLEGYIPPEYGLRSGGVIEVRSAAREERGWAGAADATSGTFGTRSASGAVQAPVGDAGSVVLSAAGQRSHRHLDPVHPSNLHNAGSAGTAEGEYAHAADRQAVSLRAGTARSSFEVPHDEEQEQAGQDQRQSLRQSHATVSWRRALSDRTLAHAAAYGRWTSARLEPGPFDTPVHIESARTQQRLGLLLNLTHRVGGHTLKAGLEAAQVRLDEQFEFAIVDADEDDDLSSSASRFTLDRPFLFADRVRRLQYSVYAQDSWRPSSRLTANFGLRFDRTRLLTDERHVSPRLGLVYRLGSGTALRVSLNRFYQPPQSEYLLLASSVAARELSPFPGGGAEVPGERQTAVEASVERAVGWGRLHLAVWRRTMRNQADPNVLFGTNIVFPNSVARGRAEGLDVGVELPRRHRWSGYLSYTLARVVQFGPINGGLFLEDEFPLIGPGTRFVPDHDQRHAASAVLSYGDQHRGWMTSVVARYQSGTPLQLDEDAEDELASRPGSDMVDLDTGRVKPHLVLDASALVRMRRWPKVDLDARIGVNNIANRRYAYNFGNPFSGTHFGAPRSLTVALRVTSR